MTLELDKNGNNYVSCGFNKWAITANRQNGSIEVGFNRIPINGNIELGDLSTVDVVNLAKLFCKWAIEDQKKS